MNIVDMLREMAESQKAYNPDTADDLAEYATRLQELWENPERSGDPSEALADLASYAEKAQKVIDNDMI